MIYCVVPTIREDRLAEFRLSWADLFAHHKVRLVVVHDGDTPTVELDFGQTGCGPRPAEEYVPEEYRVCFFNRTDSVRNYGFAVAARCPEMTHVLTLDDDCLPPPGKDPIQEHLDVLGKKVSLSWMNTAPAPHDPYLRGVPYGVRTEGTVVLSHGVWTGTPDFDAATQLQLSAEGVPERLAYHVGPVPRGVLFPFCGMNVMFAREALPWVYYAPMGPKAFGLNRFGDIWCGIALKPVFDRKGWAVYTGASTVVHSRASDVYKNLAQEAEGLRLNETAAWDIHHTLPRKDDLHPYFKMYRDRRERYQWYTAGLLAGKH